MSKSKDVKSHGIGLNREVMENGELRIRLSLEDGSAYISTESGDTGAWQNSHYHLALEETYIVQKGWCCIAELISGGVNFRIEKENCVYTVKPMVPHNLYLPAKTVLHTVKHGISKQGDWYESQELDTLTKHISEQDIKRRLKK
jgi:hypothetical protein